MSLVGRVAVLSRFVSRAIDHYAPFFDVLKGSKRFEWTDKYKQPFESLNEHLRCLPLLSKPINGGKLYLYLAISKEAVTTTGKRESTMVCILCEQEALGC